MFMKLNLLGETGRRYWGVFFKAAATAPPKQCPGPGQGRGRWCEGVHLVPDHVPPKAAERIPGPNRWRISLGFRSL